jgi:phenylacetate-CoA ligase
MTTPGSFNSSLDRIRAEQLARLRARLPEVLGRNPFWRERLQDVGGWDDFERLPLTTKADLVADQAAHPPFGTNLTHPADRYVRLHQTSGTAGARPLRWLDDAESWAWWRRLWAAHVYRSAGVGAADRVFLAFSFGPFIGFWSAFGGAEELGAMALSGAAMTTEQRVRTMAEVGATVLCCTPTYALRLAEAARELGVDLGASGLRRAVHAGEPGASIAATRAAIEAGLGVSCFDHTGMTELGPTGVSCSQRDGVHLLESEFVFEVRRTPEAGEAGQGQPSFGSEGVGELVATNLGRWGSPLIRYRTGDLVELSREPCSCGSPFVKAVGGLRGRVDDMFTVRGVNLYPSQVEDIVRRHPEVVEFVIELRHVRRMEEVTLLIECGPGEPPLERLAADLRQALGARIECRQVPPGTLPRAELKAQRLRRVAVGN